MVAGLVLLLVAWVSAWRARRTPVSPPQALAFGGALAAVLVALNGPVHALAEHYLFSAHMVQHLLLTQVFPPLALAGTPAWMIDGVLTARPFRALIGLARRLTRPLPALAVYAAALAFWHLPGPYEAAMRVHGWHIVEHLTLMAASGLAWWPVLSSSRVAPALPFGAQILYLFVFGMPMTVVAAMITAADEVLYPFYAAAPRITGLSALEDQRLGGALMWVPAGLVPVAAFSAVFFRWAAAEVDDADGPEPSGG